MDKKEAREHMLELILAVLGTAAILANLFLKGLALENIFDAIKDIVGFLVSIGVFFVARKVYKMTHKDFVGKFEELLREWASKNKYLVDEKSAQEEKGKEGKRSYVMLVDPSNLVLAKETAAATTKRKGAFVYLPTRSQMQCLNKRSAESTDGDLTIEFRLNRGTFISHQGDTSLTDAHIALIAQKFVERINEEFSEDLCTKAHIKRTEAEVIVVPLNEVPKTDEAARLLVNLVDFTKTMVLALSKPSADYLSTLEQRASNREAVG